MSIVTAAIWNTSGVLHYCTIYTIYRWSFVKFFLVADISNHSALS